MAIARTRNWRSALLCGTALVPILGGGALAQIAPDARPQGGQVVAGSASIAQDPALTQVQQSSDRAVVDWRSFNIGRDHAVQFQQPSAASITLNRVTGPDPSVIAGRMSANGQIVLVNQSGVVVTQGAQIQAQSVIISTADISNQAFMAGGPRLTFDRPGQPGARIENQGSITVREAGLAALVAPQVANRGTIAARMGRVVLGGAETHAIDLHGDGLLSLEVTGPVRQAPANGDALVSNTGLIDAPGGTVLLTAQAADGIVQDLVRAGGRIAADGTPAGRILVRGTGGTVRIEGAVTANAPEAGAGGSISAQADRVVVAGTARIEASGRAGGGRVALGTDRRGRVAPGMARRATIAPGATIRADATERGAGGEVLVNSTEITAHAGAISARGGPQGGDGGFVEVSGQTRLAITGGIDVSAPQGAAGTILLDPIFLTIVADDDPRVDIDPALLADAVLSGRESEGSFLATGVVGGFAGNLRLEATQDLTVEVALTKALGGLALIAGNNLTINAPLILQDPDPALVLVLSGAQIAINALTQVPATGRINLQTPGFLGNNIVQAGGGRFVGGTLDSGADTIPGVFVEMDLQGDNAVGNLGEIFATNLLFRNTAPLTIPAGVTVQASTLRIDVDGGDLTVDGTVIAAIGPFAATLRASGDIIVPEGGRVEGDGLRLIAGFDFASGAPDAAAAAALRLSGTIRGAFSDGDFNDVELIAGAGGILLTGAQLEGLNLDLVAGSGGIEQSGGRIFISEQLRVTTPGDATLAVTPGAALDGNRIGSLGPSDVGGDFSLTALGAVGGLDLSGDIRVAGTLTLRSRGGRISQDEGSRLLLGALDATTPGGIGLGGDNEIALVQLLVGGAFNDSVRLRNLTSLELAGTVTAEQGAVSIDVVGGDLLVSGLVSAGQDVTLRASGNTTLAAGGLVRADGNGALALVGGFNPVTGVADLAGGLVLAGTLGDAAGTNTLFLGAGTGGIQQTGGRLVGQGFGLASGGDAILDRGGDQAGARNAISGSLGSITIPGDFVLDNGNTPILLSGSTITAASIGLRTGVALSLAEPGCFPACASAPAGLQAGAGRVSLRVGELSVVTGAVIRGGLVEVAPAVPSDMAVLFPAPEAGSLNLTPTGFAAIEATALRLGATTFRGVTETTASSLRLGGPLALDIPLDLRSLGGVTQAADADLAVSRLTGRVDGPVTLTNPGNRIGTLGDFEAAAGLALRSTGALLLDGLVQAPGFTLALNVLGAVTQSPDAGITAGALSGGATGGAELEGTNQLTAIAGFDAGSGDFRLNNTAPLLELPVGTSLVAAGEVAVTNSGDLAVDGTIAAAGITLAAGDIGLGGVLEAVNTVSLTGGIIEAFGTGRIDAALLVLNASADVTLEGANQVTALGPSSLGGSLAFANSGDLLLAGSLDAAGQIVALEVTGTLTQAPGTGITAAALEGQATAGATLEGTNQLAAIASFDGGTGDFRLNNTAPLLELPAGGRLETGGTLAITQAGDLLIDGTAIGAETILDATGLLTVNGFSAIARGGDLLLRGDRVTVAGLTAALGEIGVEAADTASLGGIAIGRLLRVAAPTIRFATLDATATPVLLQLGGGGRATGSLDALALEVSGGAGAVLTGSIAGIAGQPAAAEGLRSSAIGTPLPDPPAPTAFLFNGCPIGVPLCGAVPPAPPEASPGEPGGPAVPSAPEGSPDIPISSAPPETEVVTLPGGAITAANNPAPLIEALDPAALAAAVTQTRPSVPNVTSSFARDRTEAEDLAPPNIRGGDF